MKKIVLLLLAAGIAASAAGCQSGNSENSKTETVTYWTFNAHDKDLMTKYIDDFNKNNFQKGDKNERKSKRIAKKAF